MASPTCTPLFVLRHGTGSGFRPRGFGWVRAGGHRGSRSSACGAAGVAVAGSRAAGKWGSAAGEAALLVCGMVEAVFQADWGGGSRCWRGHRARGEWLRGPLSQGATLALPPSPPSSPVAGAVQHLGAPRGLSPRSLAPGGLPGPPPRTPRLRLLKEDLPNPPGFLTQCYKWSTARNIWQLLRRCVLHASTDKSFCASIRGDLRPPPLLPPFSSQTTPAAMDLVGRHLFSFRNPGI